MSKNLTRKGLAFGAVVALGSSLFAGTPASAAELLTLAPSAGTTYNTTSTSVFTLQTGFNSSLASGFSTLKYRVQNLDAGAANLTAVVSDGAAAGDEAAYVYGAAGYAAGGGSSDAAGVTEADFVVNTGSDVGALGVTNTLALSTSAAVSAKVTAWLDADGDNTIDASEHTSAVRTIKFVAIGDVTGSVAITQPLLGDATLKASVTLDSDINVAQVDADEIFVEFGTTASATKITTFGNSATVAPDGSAYNVAITGTDLVASNKNNVVYNAVTGVFEAVFTPAATASHASNASALSVASATVYTASLLFGSTAEGAVSKATSATTTNASYKIAAVASSSVANTTTAVDDNGSTAATATGWATEATGVGAAKSGSNKGTFKVTVGTDAATPLAVASATAVVTVTPANITSGDGFVVGGKTLTGVSNTAVTFNATTGTDGTFTFDWSAADADANDTLTVQVAVNGSSSSNHNYVLTFADSTYTLVDVADTAGKALRSIKAGDQFSIEYTAVDQWGSVVPDGYGYVSVSAGSNSGRSTGASFTQTLQFVGGKAVVALTDNGVGAGEFVVTGTLNKTSALAGTFSDTEATTIKVVSDLTPATATLAALAYGSSQRDDANADGDFSDTGDTDNSTKLVLSTATFSKYDARLATSAETAPLVTASTAVTVGATIKNAAGVAVAGTPVTLAANGFIFKVGSSYFLDTVTVLSDSSGKVSADVWSQVGGAQSIKITAGAATAAQALTFAAGTATAATFTVTPSATSVLPGRTLDVTVNVKDKFGNAAQGLTVTLRSTGAGYLQSATGTTDASGNVYTKLISGVNDGGTAVIYATVAIAGVSTEKSATVTVGATAATVAASGSTGKFYVSATNAANRTVVVKVAGKFVKSFVPTSATKKVVVYVTSAGNKAVTVFVGGKLVLTKTVTVK